jgi:hypothetical protein
VSVAAFADQRLGPQLRAGAGGGGR